MNAEIIEDSGIVTKVEGNCVTVEIKPGGGCKKLYNAWFLFQRK